MKPIRSRASLLLAAISGMSMNVLMVPRPRNKLFPVHLGGIGAARIQRFRRTWPGAPSATQRAKLRAA